MGVLNVTPDSFYDGGRYLDRERAIAHGLEMAAAGADVIDVGGESTRPGAAPVPESEEMARVVPVVEALAPTVRVSIDTTKRGVAEAALHAGATLLNDVSATIADVAADAGAGYVAMHMQGTPADMQVAPAYDDVVAEVAAFLAEKAVEAQRLGVGEVWIDPGIGFGKTVEHNLALLAALPELSRLGWPVLVGTSRKSFLGKLSTEAGRGAAPGPDDRFEASLATATYALAVGASMVRVHDVAATVEARRVLAEEVTA
jgi:dihydropteroate synthase